jgi:hypothetical protein
MSDSVENKYSDIVFEFREWLKEKIGNTEYDNELTTDVLFSPDQQLSLAIALVQLDKIIEKIR